MNKLKKMLWVMLGFIFLGIAYIGVITPGIPWSTPTIISAYCFAKGNERWHNWIMNHKLFGPFLKNWQEKRIFPIAGKWAMVATMDFSLIILWFTTYNWKLVLGVATLMLLTIIWTWKYPTSIEEYQRRQATGEKISWFR